MVSVLVGAPDIVLVGVFIFWHPLSFLFWGLLIAAVWAWAAEKKDSNSTKDGLMIGGAIDVLYFLGVLLMLPFGALPP